jgi:putative sterol carrier protein
VAHRFGSEAWAASLAAEINASSEYRNAARGWGNGFNGDVLLVFEPDDQLHASARLLLRLAEGRCDEARFLETGDSTEAGFTLRAAFSVWKEILERRTLAATAILTGRMRVEGETMTLLRYTAAHRAMMHCAALVDTIW